LGRNAVTGGPALPLGPTSSPGVATSIGFIAASAFNDAVKSRRALGGAR
jgi:hypothetical protein